jgi:hypothetical protein
MRENNTGSTASARQLIFQMIFCEQFVDEVVRPRAPLGTEKREIVILEEKDVDAPRFVEHPHLPHDLRGLARSHHLSWRCAIERMNGAERASPGASATGEDRHDLAAKDLDRLKISIGEGKSVEIGRKRARRVCDDFVVVTPHDAVDGPPILVCGQRVRQLQKRRFALEADDAVELGYGFQRLIEAERRIMSTNSEMAVDAFPSQVAHQVAVAPDVVLEDQREADQNGSGSADGFNDPFRRRFDIEHMNIEARAPQHGREIAKSEVSHFLEANENHGLLFMRRAQF